MRRRENGRPVVAGYDGSKASEQALRWAVEDARMRFAPLVVCHAWQGPYPMPAISAESMEALRRMGRHALDTGANLARALAPRLEVRAELDTGPPSVVLRNRSSTAELVVVGQRGAGGFEELQIGSTAIQLAAHAHCPVAVVKQHFRPRTGLVLVAVDGTNPHRPELGAAFEEARLRQASLRAICLCPAEVEDTREIAARFHRAIAVWEEKHPVVAVETAILVGPPRAALQEAAEEADLTVIGDRAPGDPDEPPLGPLCQALLRGAPGTVIVIPSRVSGSTAR
ncbi:universal stress protein [Streptosporangium violaceochromogenes]|nr:universal stress protein [Streptosporangium violaceochromogenes]